MFIGNKILSETEASNLIDQLIDLRFKYKELNNEANLENFKKHECLCLKKFSYIIFGHASRYRNFYNYEDLIQEGYIALTNALSNFDPKKGNIFYWCHKYVSTRISRRANLHSAIKYPLKYAKANPPKRENVFPLMADPFDGYREIEEKDMYRQMVSNLGKLDGKQAKMVRMLFGIEGEEERSLAKISRMMRIPKSDCEMIVASAMKILKDSAGI